MMEIQAVCSARITRVKFEDGLDDATEVEGRGEGARDAEEANTLLEDEGAAGAGEFAASVLVCGGEAGCDADFGGEEDEDTAGKAFGDECADCVGAAEDALGFGDLSTGAG